MTDMFFTIWVLFVTVGSAIGGFAGVHYLTKKK